MPKRNIVEIELLNTALDEAAKPLNHLIRQYGESKNVNQRASLANIRTGLY